MLTEETSVETGRTCRNYLIGRDRGILLREKQEKRSSGKRKHGVLEIKIEDSRNEI